MAAWGFFVIRDLSKRGQTDAVSIKDEEAVLDVVSKTVENLWEAVNELTRLRATANKNYSVTIFGSARIDQTSPIYGEVKKLAAALTRLDCSIITGGGPGLMQAANEGALSVNGTGKHQSVGICIELPNEKGANPFVGQVYGHKTFFSRLHHFMMISDAFVVMPGGVGTMLELSMAWQLLQVRKLYGIPLILVGEMWEELIDWSRRAMLEEPVPLISPQDLEIPRCAKNIDEVLEIITKNRLEWLEHNS
jgi:uncharacterized protein (TIGR00730 family)